MDDEKKLEKKSDTKTIELLEKNHDKRRKFLASVTTGAVLAGAASGGKWVKPVVDSVILPTHAQTSLAVLEAAAQVAGNEFDAYVGIQYNADGSYPLTSDDSSGFDDFLVSMTAIFNPSQDAVMTVNMDVNVDGTYGSANISSASQSIDVAPGGIGSFGTEVDAVSIDTVNVNFAINSPGFTTRNITFNITG